MKFIIAYDIANPRRLRKVAKRLEQCAVRVQKSVFVYHGTRKQLADWERQWDDTRSGR